MSTRFALRTALAAALAAASCISVAQTAPPIRPGLWAYEMSSGDPAADAKRAERMKGFENMPPQQRAQIEAMMKQRGISMDGGGMKVCLSKDSLASGQWTQDKDSNCRTDFTQRSAAAWKWHSVCPDSESDGVATFTSADAYMVDVTHTAKGNPPRRTQIRAKYLGSDCGDIKPFKR